MKCGGATRTQVVHRPAVRGHDVGVRLRAPGETVEEDGLADVAGERPRLYAPGGGVDGVDGFVVADDRATVAAGEGGGPWAPVREAGDGSGRRQGAVLRGEIPLVQT